MANAECEEIEACEQVLCTNTTDHFCMLCESNRGMLPGQRAYTNLGTECEGIILTIRSLQ